MFKTFRPFSLNPRGKRFRFGYLGAYHLPVTMQQMADAIDEKYLGEGFFDDLKKRSWSFLCSYAHTGMLQLGRRFTGHELKAAYSDEEIDEIATAVTTAILTLASKFFAVQNLPEASNAAEQFIESYGPVYEGAAEQPPSSVQ